MKKFFVAVIIFSLFFMVSTASAWHMTWTASTGDVDGYLLSYGVIGAAVTEINVGDVTTYDLEPLSLTIGEQYEFFLKAYNASGNSGESDHLRWTVINNPIIIEMAGQPLNIIINP